MDTNVFLGLDNYLDGGAIYKKMMYDMEIDNKLD